MAEHEVKFKRYTVSFDTTPPITPDSITISPLNEEHTIPIEQGITMLVFELETINQGDGPRARFPTYPIEWFAKDEDNFHHPVNQPECFQVQWHNPFLCTIVDFNTTNETVEHP